jgi:hypothetical protein
VLRESSWSSTSRIFTPSCNRDRTPDRSPVRTPTPLGVLPARGNLRLDLTGMTGHLSLRFDRVPNAANYSVQSATDAEGLSTSTRGTINGLAGQGLLGARLRERERRSQPLVRSCQRDGGVV